jgi:predicted nuclease with RNAse H fold
MFVGIDLAGSPNRPTGFCVVDRKNHVKCQILYTDMEVVASVKKVEAKVVAIDAPLALPKGRHCLKEHCRGRTHFRACDRVLTMMRIRFFPITIGPMRALTERGIRIAKILRQMHIEVIETFPGAAQDILGIPRKQDGVEALQAGLLSLGCKGDLIRRQLTGDELDAVNCALVAKSYASGSYLAIGDPSEIMMILPNLPSGS